MATRGKIYNQIVTALKYEELNIQQLSTKTGIRWETVRNAVEALTEAGFLESDGKFYSIKKDFYFDPDTLLGIPIPEKQKKEIVGIAKRIKKLRNYNNTFLQKSVVEVIRKNNLDLPHGWYLYGPCSGVRLSDDILKDHKSTTKYEKSINETITEFDQYKNTDELMEDYYNNDMVYLSRLQIDQIFKEKLTKNSMKQVELVLQQMLFRLQDPAHYYLDAFLSSISMLKKLDEEQLNDLKLEIYTTFVTIWEIIGTQYLKDTFNVNNIAFYCDHRIEQLKENATCYLLRLKDNWPRLEFTDHIEKMRKKYLK